MSNVIQNQYTPDYVSPPGETLEEIIKEKGITQAELAEQTGRSKQTINKIINGKTAITPETALQLERVLSIPASFWHNRERHYREALVQQKEQRLQFYDSSGNFVLLSEEAEQARAEQEHQQAGRLAARLRELGENPDIL